MNPMLKALQDRLQALIHESRALQALGAPTDEQNARAGELAQDIGAVRKQIADAKALADATDGADQFLNAAPLRAIAAAPEVHETVQAIRPVGRSRTFASIPGLNQAQANERAYRFGQFMMAALGGRQSSIRFCQTNGIPIQAATGQIEAVNEDGGFLVPAEFENDLIDLREMYGVFRRDARNSSMSSDTKSRPRRKGGLTAYFNEEGDEMTLSKAAWDRVALNAKMLTVLAKTGTSLNEDAILEMGDTLAGEIAYAFAVKEDNCGFIGDATAAYGGIVGATTKLFDQYTATGGVGLIIGAGNAWSELTLANLLAVVGALPVYAEGANVKWYCHKVFFFNVMQKLALAAGGVTAAEIASGGPARFMGYPVEFTQAMPKAEANSQVPVLFGALALAADFGDRRQTTIALSEHAAFTTNEIMIRGTERFDVNVHDVGDATNPGPIVGLVTAAN